MSEKKEMMVPEETIMRKIYLVRNLRVMLDMDLAELYGVETKMLKRAVRRNQDRFPLDFMFELSLEEFENLRCQIGSSSWGGVRYPPMAFTEQGVAMLSSVLNSNRAILVNIQIIRIFTRMHEILLTHREIYEKLKLFESTIVDHDDKILLIFDYLRQLEQTKQQQEDQASRRLIGFNRNENDKSL